MLKTLTLVILSIFCCQSCGQYGNHGYSDQQHVSRPCETTDLNCIRRFFAQNSACKPIYKPAPDPLVFPCLQLPVPHANLTFIGYNYALRGLSNYVIRQFYVNRATGNLVFEVEFKEINWNTPTSTLRYHLKGREPVELSDYLSLTHRLVSLTLVVPLTHGIDISSGHVYAYKSDPYISLHHGPGLVNSDPAIQTAYKEYNEKFLTSLKEGLSRGGPIILWSFIQSVICNFYVDVNTTC